MTVGFDDTQNWQNRYVVRLFADKNEVHAERHELNYLPANFH